MLLSLMERGLQIAEMCGRKRFGQVGLLSLLAGLFAPIYVAMPWITSGSTRMSFAWAASSTASSWSVYTRVPSNSSAAEVIKHPATPSAVKSRQAPFVAVDGGDEELAEPRVGHIPP